MQITFGRKYKFVSTFNTFNVFCKTDGSYFLSCKFIFQLINIPADSLQPVLLIECPRLLFPFARRIIADMTRDGGYAPLMLDNIDFSQLYRQRMTQLQAEAEATKQQ